MLNIFQVNKNLNTAHVMADEPSKPKYCYSRVRRLNYFIRFTVIKFC